jgi:hypothetical protein
MSDEKDKRAVAFAAKKKFRNAGRKARRAAQDKERRANQQSQALGQGVSTPSTGGMDVVLEHSDAPSEHRDAPSEHGVTVLDMSASQPASHHSQFYGSDQDELPDEERERREIERKRVLNLDDPVVSGASNSSRPSSSSIPLTPSPSPSFADSADALFSLRAFQNPYPNQDRLNQDLEDGNEEAPATQAQVRLLLGKMDVLNATLREQEQASAQMAHLHAETARLFTVMYDRQREERGRGRSTQRGRSPRRDRP